MINERYVLDASVAAKWFLNDEDAVDIAETFLIRFLEAVLKLIPDATDVRRFVMLSVAEASFPPELVRDELAWEAASCTPLLRLRCAPLRMTGQ